MGGLIGAREGGAFNVLFEYQMPPLARQVCDQGVSGVAGPASAFRTTFSHHAAMTGERPRFFGGAHRKHRYVHCRLYITQAACTR